MIFCYLLYDEQVLLYHFYMFPTGVVEDLESAWMCNCCINMICQGTHGCTLVHSLHLACCLLRGQKKHLNKLRAPRDDKKV